MGPPYYGCMTLRKWLESVDFDPTMKQLVDRYEDVLNYYETLKQYNIPIPIEWGIELGLVQIAVIDLDSFFKK